MKKMAKNFKLSSPLQPVLEIKNAIREAKKADASVYQLEELLMEAGFTLPAKEPR
jgi:hypothetical protein